MMQSAATNPGGESCSSDDPLKRTVQQQQLPPTALSPTQADFVMRQTQLELGHIARAGYPYPEAFYGSYVAAYGGQPMISPHVLGVHQVGLPLPLSDAIEEAPVYVNAKQYHGILRRRQSRAKAESENKVIKSRKPYLHESRHLHALRRARGCGGRFLNTKKEGNSQEAGSSIRDSQNSGSEKVGNSNPNMKDDFQDGLGVNMSNDADHTCVRLGFHASAFNTLPSGSKESGQVGGMVSTSNQHTAVATQ